MLKIKAGGVSRPALMRAGTVRNMKSGDQKNA
ncbi:hypothetical protein BSS2_I1224 [Brucella suis bv. 1 str. S2]|uniref:Uncharacterized protein n=3 Tax=Brucella TaxID=234 RepID=Q2YQG7_BRUA2|nr:hypothetical protein BR1257 [Brucella suis 1330]AAX74598.1 hypothetical protein BruAb1_1260 [Brucella abortus bv. 1 str. 9-941]AEU06261.1 hypothetical protein BSVBI22_A1253 [Brucella suis VBI22]AHN46880.1 hypothetical protein BSS2_I1224 [Brucella suis bv. 1 str. S2]EFM57172.1 Hypothetical protein BIBO1_0827 [Brucella inopinata BO1]EFM61889.1 Hypothetical protein BROD_1920 [Brucella sp. NF 2653]CAJ11232.1 conserved hypothetical protein [Brucella abortus 2308]CDL76648.1 unnamed protein prod